MKVKKSKTGTTKALPESQQQRPDAVDLAALRQEITKLIGNDALQMVAATIEQVHQGHYQALKYLFEVIGLYPATDEPDAHEQDSLAKTLLKYLGVPEGKSLQGETKAIGFRDHPADRGAVE